MEKAKKRGYGALALTTALVLAGCLNSRPLYAVGLAGERQSAEEGRRPPVAGAVQTVQMEKETLLRWRTGPLYDRLEQLPGGLCLAERQGRFGVVDGQGNILEPLVYPDEFSARRAAYGIQAEEAKAARSE